MASRSLIGAGAVVTAALVGIGVGAYANSGDERGTVELVDVSTTPSPSVHEEPSSEPAAEPETTTTTATVEPEPVVTSVAPPPAPKQEEPVSKPVAEPKPESTYTGVPAANSREAGNPDGPPMGDPGSPPPAAPEETYIQPPPDQKVWGDQPPPAPAP